MSDSPFLSVWRAHLKSGEPGLHLADSDHPLKLFVGLTEPGAPRVVIRSGTKPVKPSLSDLVLVERYEDQSKKWNLSFTLQDRAFDEVFLRLFDDANSRSAGAVSEGAALQNLNKTLDEWRRLLKPRPSGVLTMEELRGLIGELWLLLNVFGSSRPMATALEGWLGPLGLPQDFWYQDSSYHEAKSIGPATTRVKISSAQQLDAMPLELLILRVASTDEGSVGATNLPSLVSAVEAALTSESVPLSGLHERLDHLRVKLDEAFYVDTWFVVAGYAAYDVTGDFPAVRSSQQPAAISRVTYQIEVAAIEEFRTQSVEVL